MGDPTPPTLTSETDRGGRHREVGNFELKVENRVRMMLCERLFLTRGRRGYNRKFHEEPKIFYN